MKSIIEEAMNKPQSAEKTEDRLEEFGSPKIMVVGAGGAGCNAVNRLANMGISGAQLVGVNTDKQHLAMINDELTKILIGKSVTRGLGAGGYPEIGAKAAEVSRNALEEILDGVDMLFISAGMGGGTGTGSAPIIAEIAKQQGAIVIAIVTYPFALERARLIKAEEGIETLRKNTDTVVVIDNNRLVELVPNLPIQDAFKVADEVMARTVRGITETITQPSLINLDFADVRSVMVNQGLSVIAVGESKSVDKVNEVVEDTLKNALLDVDITGAKGCLIHITGGPELTLGEANAVGEMLTDRIDPKAAVIWGARVDPTFENKMEVISIFTGVHSPYIKGGSPEDSDVKYDRKSRRDLGLDFVR
ncbi:MAG: cell division protein FtsZ [Candidatus Diapherotrites archaeon]|uniref:Cell division protein FtsZ n=1 Tax=Candidatus Iainarchaeum sp. TaxID=3101447 RepID=A0A7J4IV76_9ARCH|nr:MAG: cell division protein FtsZ [archaeon GW2011_AR10]MBS3058884.1 cell division protein FtsZ [Candidatus Diapherotrites archaeon]HIH08720.1 cell division protein FtsZ [Candidatus Diapherotrites archaeon]